MLAAEGMTEEEVLDGLPYDSARAPEDDSSTPDARRYRDYKHVCGQVGLLYENDEGRIELTDLGRATGRWLDDLNAGNLAVFGRHAAFALAACQLRNPTRAGRKYAEAVEVFPFAFIWRAMLALDGMIASHELNREIFRVTNEDELEQAIQKLRFVRRTERRELLAEETITGSKNNDRIIPWVAAAGFGWLLIGRKRAGETGDHYEIRPQVYRIVEQAARIRYPHRTFSDVSDYVAHISRAAALPEDMR